MPAPKRLKDGGKRTKPLFEVHCGTCQATWFEQPTVELAERFCELAPTAAPPYKDINGKKHHGLSGCPYKRRTPCKQ